MAIMLDGQYTTQQVKNKVTYKAPAKVTYTQPKNTANDAYQRYVEEQKRKQQQQRAQNAYAQRMQAQADAYRNQQQAMQQKPVYPEVGWQQNAQGQWTQQTNTGNYKSPTTNPIQMPTTMNMGYGKQSQNAWAQRYQQQAQQYGSLNSSPTKPYHPVTNPGGYKGGMDYVASLPMNWREQNASVLMTPSEWMKRRQAWEKIYGNIFVNESEWTKRNQAAPPGYMWTPFGTGSAKLNTAPTAQTTAPAPDYGGGGYDDWGNWGGGGGGGGSTYTPKPPEWWVEMVNWRI